MGATVTTDKAAAAFKAVNGKVMYVLFEKTYEKNCHPHTPEWGCFFIGEIGAAMRGVFLHASSCEGGMLQNRNGRITPEGYISGWLEKLADPVEFRDRTITLKANDEWNAAVPNDSLEKVSQKLAALGRQDLLDTLTGGSIELSLYADADLLANLYDGSVLAPWRIIRGSAAPIYGVLNADLGYAPTSAKTYDVYVPNALKVDGENRLIQGEDGAWRCQGWEYSIVQSYICRLWEAELREPGSYRKRIKVFRDALKTAPLMPQGVKVVVNRTIPLDSSYQQGNVEKMSKESVAVTTASGFEIAIPAIPDPDDNLLWHLMQLPVACTSWVMPVHGHRPAGGEQLELLAA